LNFGFLGSEGIAQTYFLGLIPEEKMLDLGILYFMIFGVAGSGGSLIAGIFLDMFKALGISDFISFKILYITQIILTLIALTLQGGLRSLGSMPLRGALEVIFSMRELRAISLLDRLNKAQDSNEEEVLIGELYHTPSQLALNGLLERARSPRLVTRFESIRALEKLPTLDENAEKALIDDITNNPFTTAYISARILGNHHRTAAIPLLRELASSTDYMLAGESIIALSRMKDEVFRPQIEKILLDSKNPRLKIMGAEALGLYNKTESLPVLFNILRGSDPPPYLLDEVALSMAAILGTQRQFYKILDRYVADKSLAATLAMDEVESAHEFYKNSSGNKRRQPNNESLQISQYADTIHKAVSEYMLKKNGTELSRWIFDFPDCNGGHIVRLVLSEAVLDDELSANDCLRLLISHWSAYQLRSWAARIK
jgi:hypothetical protein